MQSRLEEDTSEYISMNTVRRRGSQCSSHTCIYTLSRCESPVPATKQRSCSVPLRNHFRILGEEPVEAAVTHGGSKRYLQHQPPKVLVVTSTETGLRGYVQIKQPQVAGSSAPLRPTEQGRKS